MAIAGAAFMVFGAHGIFKNQVVVPGVMDGGTMTSTSGLVLSRQHSVQAFLTSRTMP